MLQCSGVRLHVAQVAISLISPCAKHIARQHCQHKLLRSFACSVVCGCTCVCVGQLTRLAV